MPQELPESLLYAPLKGEAPADPKDLMVENAAPLKMVPPIGDDTVVPPADK
ncbi:UNVERIFIED_CONTAM: hypothetical protein Sradi_5494600 [Sesamum radiatum]|uniref:Uncharacterized protein n=1 Tax=Sesamum radiatum TaxID=300843 RepID=A0AAW2LCM0_SESRA